MWSMVHLVTYLSSLQPHDMVKGSGGQIYSDIQIVDAVMLFDSLSQKSWLMTNGSTSTASNSIYTGVGNISRLAEFLEWNGHKYVLDTWRSPEANQIRGTEGMFFKPNLQLGQPLVLFMGNLLRSFDLQNTGTVDHLGMETLRYEFDSRVFRGAFSDPGNARWDSWCPDGLFYVGPVKDPEIPVYVSKPHFLDGDSGLLEGVDGLDPSRESHDSHIDVEPTFGVNVDFSIRFQLNVRVNISSNFRFGNINETCSCDHLFRDHLYPKTTSHVPIVVCHAFYLHAPLFKDHSFSWPNLIH